MMPHDWTYWSRSLPPNWRRTGTHTVQKRHSLTHTYKCCEFDNILYESNGHFLMCVWCSYFTWSTSSFLLFQRLSRTFDFVCIFGRWDCCFFVVVGIVSQDTRSGPVKSRRRTAVFFGALWICDDECVSPFSGLVLSVSLVRTMV